MIAQSVRSPCTAISTSWRRKSPTASSAMRHYSPTLVKCARSSSAAQARWNTHILTATFFLQWFLFLPLFKYFHELQNLRVFVSAGSVVQGSPLAQRLLPLQQVQPVSGRSALCHQKWNAHVHRVLQQRVLCQVPRVSEEHHARLGNSKVTVAHTDSRSDQQFQLSKWQPTKF